MTKWIAGLTESALLSYAILASLYSLLILALPASQATMREYDISALQYKVILFAVAIPSLLAWLAAFLSYSKLRQYAISIHRTADGPAFAQLARGATWLAWSLPLSAIINLILNSIAYQSPSFKPFSIIFGNYLSLVLLLVAFLYISNASRSMFHHVKLEFSLFSRRAIMLFFIIAGASYCYFTFRSFDLSSINSTQNPYYLPIWLMVLTVIIPYMYTWFIGLLSGYEITLISQKIRGLLYRRALKYLALGLVIVIVCSIAIQYFNAIQPRLGYLLIDSKLLFTTLLRLVRGAGFVLIVYGALKLKRIEEV